MTVCDAARAKMIDCQLRPNKVTDERILAAFARVQRELFVPEPLRGVAYVDEDLPLGRGRYLMEPMVAARLLQAAMPDRKDTALVVGAGVGYEAALLALLARSVVALEPSLGMRREAQRAKELGYRSLRLNSNSSMALTITAWTEMISGNSGKRDE